MRLTSTAAATIAIATGVALGALALGAPAPLAAHPGAPLAPHDLPWSREAWPLEWPVVAGVAASAWLYARGVRRLWARAGRGRGVARWRATAFGAGLATTALALLTPLASVGTALFSVHMLQHVALMLVAAPLLVLGTPARAMPFALPPAARRRLAVLAHAPAVRRPWRALTHPASAWTLHAVAVLAWHAPALFEATLRSEVAHVAQHVSFFGTALLFWGALGPRGHSARLPAGAGVLYVFTTGVYSAALGAWLALADRPIYLGYVARVRPWGLSPLEDQQLAGLVMWVPAGLVYVGAALALLAAWLRAAERAIAVSAAHARTAEGRATGRRSAGATARAVLCATFGAVLGACERGSPVREAALVPGGEPARAPALIARHGCGSCHVIPGIPGAVGRAGPPLARLGERRVIAGRLPNTPENVVRFTVDPYAVDPASLMPDTGIGAAEARHVVAYLLRAR
jgi:cytochrome c oxidase assembly factor CtaG